MFWGIAIIIIAVIIASLDSGLGQVVIAAAVTAIGLLLLSWITGIGFLVTLAKGCAVIIVVAIVGTILLGILG